MKNPGHRPGLLPRKKPLAIPPRPQAVASWLFPVNATAHTAEGYLTPGAICLKENTRTIRFEIPADYQALKADDPALALEWRLAVRRISEAYFAAGYTVADFFHCRTRDGERSYYILQAD